MDAEMEFSCEVQFDPVIYVFICILNFFFDNTECSCVVFLIVLSGLTWAKVVFRESVWSFVVCFLNGSPVVLVWSQYNVACLDHFYLFFSLAGEVERQRSF